MVQTKQKKRQATVRSAILAGWILGLGVMQIGCVQQGVVERPSVLVEAWETQWDQGAVTPEPRLKAWWQSFGSDALNELIEQALAQHPDVNTAWLHLARAELQLGAVQAERIPMTLAAGADAQMGLNSETSSWQQRQTSQLRFNVSYEVDLWGRVAAQQAAGIAQFDATQYDLLAVQLSVSSRVAETWFQWLALQVQLNYAQAQLDRLQTQQALIQTRWEQGMATPAEVASRRSSLLQQRSQWIQLNQHSEQTRRALALLLGQPPQDWQPPEGDLLQLLLPLPDPGLPTDLLLRRPDLARAEARLRQAEANVTQARAALFPSLNLLTSVRLASDTLFLHDPVSSFNLTSSLAQTLFDRGARQRQIQLNDLQRQSLVEQYRQSLLNALLEVDNALEQVQVQQYLVEQQQALIEVQETLVEQVQRRYQLGSETLSQWLDAQAQLERAYEQRVLLQRTQLLASIQLYRALGGGGLD